MSLSTLTKRQFETVLAVTTLAVYVLIATGATLASTGTTACSQWPLCVPAGGITPAFLLVFGHRALTALVGLLLVVTVLAGLSLSLDWRARIALYSVALAFPVQVLLGALVVLADLPAVAELHLALGTGVFVLLLTALAWTLEDETADQESAVSGEETTNADSPGDTAVQAAQPEPETVTVEARARAYLELTKPRLMWLLCLLALAGMALATTTGTWPSGVEVAATLAGGILAIGASGTFNHLYERDRDRKMERTAERPVATSEIPPRNAAAFGFLQLGLSLGIVLTFVNAAAAALTLAAVFYYSVVYTVVLKPNTSWNIAIGGGAGALPALIGWAAVTGGVGLGGLLLAGLVVVWTPPHFYNLAIVYRDDYARAGYPMFPVVAGVSAARRRILLTLGATLLVTVALVVWTPLAWLFTAGSILAGALFSGVPSPNVGSGLATRRCKRFLSRLRILVSSSVQSSSKR
ncbi:heme o synthase [Halovenus salina]|uniref:Protoheme IX farnesyltransferase n=1 Tax=Halovenus salina TaxID=1510225 RepID=A0ABD5W092_9EURY